MHGLTPWYRSIILHASGGLHPTGKGARYVAKRISVSNELHLVMGAVRGAHALTRHWIENYGIDLDDVPDAIAALLVISHREAAST